MASGIYSRLTGRAATSGGKGKAQTPRPPPALGFAIGSRVSVQDLVAKPKLNGKIGTVVGAQGSERVQVKLDNGEGVAVKPANLKPTKAFAKPPPKATAVPKGMTRCSDRTRDVIAKARYPGDTLDQKRGCIVGNGEGEGDKFRLKVKFEGPDGEKEMKPENLIPFIDSGKQLWWQKRRTVDKIKAEASIKKKESEAAERAAAVSSAKSGVTPPKKPNLEFACECKDDGKDELAPALGGKRRRSYKKRRTHKFHKQIY